MLLLPPLVLPAATGPSNRITSLSALLCPPPLIPQNRSVGRFKTSFIKQFAEQELYSLLRRTSGAECVALVASRWAGGAPTAAAAVGAGGCIGTLDVRLLDSGSIFAGSWPEGVPREPAAAAAYVSNVVVAENQRGQGLGRELVRAALLLVRQQWQAELAYCHVEVDNEVREALACVGVAMPCWGAVLSNAPHAGRCTQPASVSMLSVHSLIRPRSTAALTPALAGGPGAVLWCRLPAARRGAATE